MTLQISLMLKKEIETPALDGHIAQSWSEEIEN